MAFGHVSFLLLVMVTVWCQVAAVPLDPLSLHEDVTHDSTFELVGEKVFFDHVSQACTIPPRVPGEALEMALSSFNGSAAVWHVDTGESTPLEPSSEPAAGCAVADMEIGGSFPAHCIGVATVDPNHPVRIYCERLLLPGYELFAEFDTQRDTRAVAALAIPGRCTMWAFADWTQQEIKLMMFDVGTQAWTDLQTFLNMNNVHRLFFIEDLHLNVPHLLAADMSGDRVVSFPLASCGGATAATQTAPVEGARSVAKAVVEEQIRIYVATGSALIVVLEQTNTALTVLRHFDVNDVEGGKAMNATMEVAVCDDHHLLIAGEPEGVVHYHLTPTGEEYLGVLSAPRSAAVATYQEPLSSRCEFVVAALNGGETSLHYAESDANPKRPVMLA